MQLRRHLARSLAGLILLAGAAGAHTVDYQVDSVKSIAVAVRFGDDEPASYSEYEVFAPGQAKTPYALGRTDAKGRVLFAPDQPGEWTVKVKAESSHGVHGATVRVDVNPDQTVKDYSRPLVARHTRLLVGVGIVLGLFGLASFFRRPNRSSATVPGPG